MPLDPKSLRVQSLAALAVSAVAPVLGLECPDVADKSTWSLTFDDGATADQRAAAQAAIDAFVAPDPVPHVISDRQFFQQLAAVGIITAEEALAAVGPGEIPAAMLTMVAALPEADQFPARMLLTGATQFDRSHPLVPMFGAAFGWTGAQVDAFWTAAAAL